MLRGRKFQFSWGLTLMVLAAAALCYLMSYWQYTRYEDKVAYFERLEMLEAQGALTFNAGMMDFSAILHGEVQVAGTFDYQAEMVLINRSHEGRAGVKVVTPLALGEGGPWILVDRGFVPYDDFHNQQMAQYQIPGTVEFKARVRPSQDRTFFFAPPQSLPKDGSFKDRWLRLEIGLMEKQLKYPLLPVYLERSEPVAGAKYPAPFANLVLKPARHMNYVLQWAGFGTFALFLGVFLQFRKPKRLTFVDGTTSNAP